MKKIKDEIIEKLDKYNSLEERICVLNLHIEQLMEKVNYYKEKSEKLEEELILERDINNDIKDGLIQKKENALCPK